VATDAAAAAPHPAGAATPLRQAAGTAPGDVGSQAGLLPRFSATVPAAAPESVPVAGSAPAVTTTAAAVDRTQAAAAGQRLLLCNPSQNGGSLSRERY
jgi:hypothetical protein